MSEIAELERRLSRRAWIDRLAVGFRVRLCERGREVHRYYRPTRRQCARIGLSWVDDLVPKDGG